MCQLWIGFLKSPVQNNGRAAVLSFCLIGSRLAYPEKFPVNIRQISIGNNNFCINGASVFKYDTGGPAGDR